MRTMTASQMYWNLKKGFAWFELDSEGNQNDDWRMPIWTKPGGWLWNVPTIDDPNGHYELCI